MGRFINYMIKIYHSGKLYSISLPCLYFTNLNGLAVANPMEKNNLINGKMQTKFS